MKEPSIDYSIVDTSEKDNQTMQQKEVATHNAAADAAGFEKINTRDEYVPDYVVGGAQEQAQEDAPVQEPQPTQEVAEEPQSDQEEGRITRVESEVTTQVEAPLQSSEQPVFRNEVSQKIDSFLSDNPGASLQDYLRLNDNIDDMSGDDLLLKHVKAQNPDFNDLEVKYYLEDQFGDLDIYAEDQESKEYVLANMKKKQALAKATDYFKEQKDKYYQDLKINNGTNNAQEDQARLESQQKASQHFEEQTNDVFGKDFKGFEFDFDGDKLRYEINDIGSVKDYQSDVNNFFNEHLDENGMLKDAGKYHKSLWASQNADKIARHFYKQGKADAVESAAKDAKNIDMTPKSHKTNQSTATDTPYKVYQGDIPKSNRLSINTKYTK